MKFNLAVNPKDQTGVGQWSQNQCIYPRIECQRQSPTANLFVERAMKGLDFLAIHEPGISLRFETQQSSYCRSGTWYLIPKESAEAEMKAIPILEREIARQKDRYRNVLKGLQYWKVRAEKSVSGASDK
jgi:hypothetical protein